VHLYGEENISKEQIEDQLRILNEDFQRLNADTTNTRPMFKGRAADCEVEFKLARIAPDGSCTEGITRHYSELTVEPPGYDAVKSVVMWDYRKYLNIWIVKEIQNTTEGRITLGYAVFPGDNNAATRDGIVMRADRTGTIGIGQASDRGRTLTHEVGHWLGLYHTFQGGCRTNNNFTDRVNDTPPVEESSSGCPTNANTCSNDNPNEMDMVENYMDYSNGSCMNAFTEGQKTRMNNNLNNSSTRGRNIASDNLIATGVNTNPSCGPIADFWVEEQRFVICPGSKLNFKDWSYNGEITERLWTFEGGTPYQSTFENVEVTFAEAGTYEVTLEVSNAQGSNSLTRTAFITVLPEDALVKAPFGQDFAESTSTIGWSLEKDAENYGWSRTTSTGYSGNTSLEAAIDQFSASGSRYSLTLPPLDLSNHGTPISLNYKYAYGRSNTTSTEILFVLVSTNCGQTWTTMKVYNAANGLATGPTQVGWRPSNVDDWARNSIDLTNYSTENNILFRFDVIGQSGNSVFIDDINIGQYHLSTEDLILDTKFQVYPNPAKDIVNYSFNASVKNIEVSLTDISGRVISTETINQNTGSINTSQLANGVYNIQAMVEGVRVSKKLIINR
jgi:PKD repeat protein